MYTPKECHFVASRISLSPTYWMFSDQLISEILSLFFLPGPNLAGTGEYQVFWLAIFYYQL